MTQDEAVGAAEAQPPRPDPVLEAGPSEAPSSEAADRRPPRTGRKAAKRAARQAKQAAKRAAKAARKAERKAAQAARKAERRAAREAKRAAKAERKAGKAQRKAARATREVGTGVDTGVADGVRPGAGPAVDGADLAPVAGTMLEEVAELVRRAKEPPAARILERVDARAAEQAAVEDLVTAVGRRAVIGAAVDVGANSAHLLVAAAGGHRVEPLLDESAFLGLGDRVARDGYIGEAARAELVHTLAGYVATARRMGARDIVLLGTEPVRRALDAAALAREVEARSGVGLHVIDHDEEAMLMLLGVTMGRPVRVETLVVDIGGGSCEFVITGPGRPVRSSGLRLGCAALTQDAGAEDPPTGEEVEAMRRVAREAVTGAPDASPSEIVAVGGTASNMLRLLPAAALDRVLSRRRMAEALALVMQESSLDAAGRHLLRPQRARILPAGIVIADAILERYGATRLRVSEEGIREGAVLASAAFGAAWRDQLPVLVAGWPDDPANGD